MDLEAEEFDIERARLGNRIRFHEDLTPGGEAGSSHHA
jgi:hypothetical protein